MTGRVVSLAASALLLVSGAAAADDLDGKHVLVCTLSEVAECDLAALCDKITREEVELPEAFRVDFNAKLLRSTDGQRSSPIGAVEASEGALIAQGTQNSRGWSLVVDRATGHMNATITEAAGAIVLAGSCSAPKP